jgi:hypothetical protein
MNLTDTLRRLGLIVAAGAALAAAGLTVSGCKGASPTEVDCTGTTAAIKYVALQPPSTLDFTDFVADGTVGTAVAVPGPTLVLDQNTFPQSCVSHPTYAAADLPPGLAVDAATGAITGTPTQSGLFVFQVTVTLSGSFGTTFHSGRIAFEVLSPTLRAFSGWADGRLLPDSDGMLASQGGQLAFLRAGTSALEVLLSNDDGLNWTLQTPPASPPARTGFTSATDAAGHLYVSGGIATTGGAALADLWMFDGVAWTELATTTAFPGASVMFASAGHLYAVNGGVWRSDDDGATWNAITDHVWAASEPAALKPFCGVDLAGVPVVVGQLDPLVDGQAPTVRAWTSPDAGATWAEQSLPTSGPFSAIGGVSQCMGTGGHLFIVSDGHFTDSRHDVVGTSDFGAWEYQPRRPEWSRVLVNQGSTVIAGRMYAGYQGIVYGSQP